MSLPEHAFFGQKMRELKANPIRILGEFQLTVGLSKGYQTEQKDICFSAVDSSVHGKHLRFGNKSFCRVIPGGAKAPISVNCLATPMRSWDDQHRQDALQRYNAGGNSGPEFWVTVRQTGCSVLILDWGGGSCSMVHISPYDKSQFNAFSRTFLKANTTMGASMRGRYLRGELTTIANTSRQNGENPWRYILIQSSFSVNEGKMIQVLGIPEDGNWEFYLQTKHASNLSVEKLEWQAWNWHSSYRPVSW